MGSSKKHKDKDREGKKKRKHRSRSRSRSRERKRRHRDRSRTPTDNRDRTSGGASIDADVEFLHRDDDYREDSRYDNRNRSEMSYDYQQAPQESTQQTGAQEPRSSGDGSSLSIEETNRLRAKLGLKPLDVPEKGEDGKPKKTDAVHAPPINLAQKKKTEALKEKMTNRKTQREIQSKLGKVKGLGESDSDEDNTSSWVIKSRKLQKERDMAEKRAKMLEEMDEDFGIGNLVEQEFQKDTRKGYSSQDLSGLKVEHGLDKFTEGRNVILTLKDRGVLDEEEEGDVLVNVNIEDDEKAEKNVDNKKKKPDYKPYDEPQYDEYGMMKPSNMLEKYDEEIDGAKKESFTLGSRGHYDASEEKRMAEIRQQLRAQGESLLGPAPTLAVEYMTKEEVKAATFKKTKKKVRKIRKKDILKADDLLPLAEETTASEDYGSRARGRGKLDVKEEDENGESEETKMNVDEPAFSTDLGRLHAPSTSAVVKPKIDDDDVIGPEEDLTGVDLEEEEAQNELHGMLAKARKLNLKKERKSAAQSVEQMAVKSEPSDEGGTGANIILNSTSEFCRNLGEIPTYGLSGNREEDRDELLDMELELMEQRRKEAEQEETTGGWNEVDIDENPVDIKAEETSVLEEEPIATDGIGAALKLAMKKGYLEDEEPKKLSSASNSVLELQAQNYTIQDKRYDDLDEKNRKRDRYSGGMVSEFKEKDLYKPDVKLDYVDESGRMLSQKEAFRQLSHRFHGKGSGKKKTEKRGKKVEEELLMKQMSSTDTPLNTLSLLQDKQRSEKSPYIVLSGSKGFTSNSIVKPS
ncbi:U4/U6.U5 tri-snRNP-associated protein 1 [Aplysia californica]|uniref:U4/U6.U5 tri-snRNP-associated protein 1 n=1 Tax=Aplysia californica TaxID=6500 RepID=A0ABM0JSJ7_APLCA|nr:U4/U6.U5 tri-snRNP-associated protein 1 [Aplysia californica]